MRCGPPGRLAGLVPLLALLATSAQAGTEDFSTFGLYAQQIDDESLLDHLLTAPPRAWREPWERSLQGLRTSQGCMTSGEWVIDTQLKVRAPLGERSTFGLDVRDQESDELTVQYFDFSFRFPTGAGTPGFFYRPLFDKSRQDFGVFWEFGAETSDVVARATFTFEDLFNNLWSFRQAQVGNDSEPYERHPFEPALWLRWSRPTARAEIGGQWLTPSRKRFQRFDGSPEPHATLWGALGFTTLEWRFGRFALEAGAVDRQALSREAPGGSALYGGDFRRQWSLETAARRTLGQGSEIEARWIYRDGIERSDPPFPSRRLSVVDRVVQVEARSSRGRFGARLGGLHDRITVALEGAPLSAYGTRIESRGYLGLSARFGRVLVDVVEGIELDPEPYDVWGLHDKAFAHLQTTF